MEDDEDPPYIWLILPIGLLICLAIYLCRKFGFGLKVIRKNNGEVDAEQSIGTSHGSKLSLSCSEIENETVPSVVFQPSTPKVATVVPKDSNGISAITTGSVTCLSEPVVKAHLSFLQQRLLSETKDECLKETIRSAQSILLMREHKPSESSLQTALVIGVDARPNVLGGYCVNLREMSLEYYAIKMADFPIGMENTMNPNEFEMKNLQFALSVWSKTIRKYKTFRIYTDNNAIDDDEDEYGSDAVDLVDHFTDCEDAKRINEKMHVNRKQDIGAFAKYIQPADDFSRWAIDKGIDFLCQYYGINKANVRGTHQCTKNATSTTRAWYEPTDIYNQRLQKAKGFARNFRCENCLIYALIDVQQSINSGQGQKRNAGKRKKTGQNLRRLQHRNSWERKRNVMLN